MIALFISFILFLVSNLLPSSPTLFPYTTLFRSNYLPRGRQHEFVHARAIERDVVRAPKQREQIVRGQDRVVRCLGKAFFAERSHIGVRADKNAEVPIERPDAADRVTLLGLVAIRSLIVVDDPGLREKCPQRLLHAQRTSAGATGAVWRRE